MDLCKMLSMSGLQETPEADVGHTAEGAMEGTSMVLLYTQVLAGSCVYGPERKT
jgi:hypothetical protein